MLESTALPVLLMLQTSSLFTHEDCDPRRVESISRRILEEGILKNPPMVAKVPGTDRYVVLDGANRTVAFQSVGIPHIVAQLVSYDDPGVVLDTWYHVVSGITQDDLELGLEKIDGIELVQSTQEEARLAVRSGQAASYIINDHGVRMIVSLEEYRNKTCLKLLGQIVGVYKGKADIIRASNDIWEIQKPCYPDITALIVFRPLCPEDIMEAARNGEKVPSGITRHIIPARALNINIPIGILMADWTLKRKREWLGDWWMERLGANAIRYYAESTFSFNE